MPRPYSADLRERVLVAFESNDGSRATIARHYDVAEATVSNWIQALQESGRRTAKPPGRGMPPLLTAEDKAVLLELVAEDNDATRQQYCDRLAERCHVRVGVSTMGKTLKQLGVTRKKDLASQRTGSRGRQDRAQRIPGNDGQGRRRQADLH